MEELLGHIIIKTFTHLCLFLNLVNIKTTTKRKYPKNKLPLNTYLSTYTS